MNAVQGAAMAGAKHVIAIDPIEFKREKAMEFGATHTFGSMEDAFPEVRQMTQGRLADKVIMTPGVMYGDLMELGTGLAGKGSTIVVTAVAPITQKESSVNLLELAMEVGFNSKSSFNRAFLKHKAKTPTQYSKSV